MKQINIAFAECVIVGVHFRKVTTPVGIQHAVPFFLADFFI